MERFADTASRAFQDLRTSGDWWLPTEPAHINSYQASCLDMFSKQDGLEDGLDMPTELI